MARRIRCLGAADGGQRKPTMARLVADSIPLLGDEAGGELRKYCGGVLEDGPSARTDEELQLARYFLTDLIDDLDGGATLPVMDAIAVELWRRSAELLLSSAGRWIGGGKALIREVEAFDAAGGTAYAERLHVALHDAVVDSPRTLVALVDEVLDRVGGRLREGLNLAAALPDRAG